MIGTPFISWPGLRQSHPADLVALLQSDFARGGFLTLTSKDLCARSSCTPEQAQALLNIFTQRGWLSEKTKFYCPACGYELLTEEAAAAQCPECTALFCDCGGVRTEHQYEAELPQPRDVDWVLALHGMNSRGAWQEEFNWLVSRSYGQMVPVVIYKYGIIRPGVFLRFRQRTLTRQLIRRMQQLIGDATGGGFGPVPDVIAHSFGTWLLGHALRQNPDLKVGRIILTGCILRPDFDWQGLKDRGQVEVILNHYGTQDFWAWIAHYFIPDSGPAGRRGFDGGTVLNLPAHGFGHTDFFEEKRLPDLFRQYWQTFLQRPSALLDQLPGLVNPKTAWQPTWWLLRAILPRYVLLISVTVALLSVLGALWLGFPEVVHVLSRLFK